MTRVAAAVLLNAACVFGQAVDASDTPATRPATSPATAPANSADVAGVREMIEQYNQAVADGNVDGIEALIATSTNLEKRAIGEISKLGTASRNLFETTKRVLGAEKLEQAGVTRESFPTAFPRLPLEQLEIKVTGDTATLVSVEGGEVMPLSIKKTDNAWKIDGSTMLPPFTEQQLNDQAAILDAVVASLNKTAKDVEAGHITAADEVVVLMQHRLQKAAQEAQMKMMQQQLDNAGDGSATQPASGPATAPAAE